MSSVPRGDSDRQPPNEPTYTVGSLFTGIGGIDLAFAAAGFDVRWQVEIDPYCRAVLAKHAPHYWPNAEQHADIHDCHDLPHVDVVVAGFPCQPFSLAGKRLGVNDDRYLIPELLRVISEVKPYAALFENVPGFTSIDDGNTFTDFLRALAEMGYDAEWGRLSAASVGAPHKRERWFCVAYRVGARVQRRAQAGNTGGKRTEAKQYAGRRHQTLVNAKRSGQHRIARRRAVAQSANGHQRPKGTVERRLDRNANGLSDWLDGHRWPAGLGQRQHDYEPPRVVTGAKNRTARIKALGNAVVPQVILPLAAAVREFLDARAEEGGAE